MPLFFDGKHYNAIRSAIFTLTTPEEVPAYRMGRLFGARLQEASHTEEARASTARHGAIAPCAPLRAAAGSIPLSRHSFRAMTPL